jgi:hypothetical protein
MRFILAVGGQACDSVLLTAVEIAAPSARVKLRKVGRKVGLFRLIKRPFVGRGPVPLSDFCHQPFPCALGSVAVKRSMPGLYGRVKP